MTHKNVDLDVEGIYFGSRQSSNRFTSKHPLSANHKVSVWAAPTFLSFQQTSRNFSQTFVLSVDTIGDCFYVA